MEKNGSYRRVDLESQITYLKRACENIGVILTEDQLHQFYRYYEILTEWNQVMNLTAITEYEDVVQKHFADSLALIPVCGVSASGALLDVGTGAGFPGIPLKIAFPELRVTLLDSLNKRVKFLNQVIETLGLSEIWAFHGRAEDFAKKKEFREQFDLCVSRAVANLASLSEYCIPFVRMGGLFISYKSGNSEEEISQAGKAIQVLGGHLREVKEFFLPDSDISRSFVMIEKRRATDKKYPRKAGLPGKEPILS